MGLTINIPAIPLRSWFPTALIWLVVATVALLNPLACLIHCAVLDMSSHGHHTESVASRFLCDMRMDHSSIATGAAHHGHVTTQPAHAGHMDGTTPDSSGASVPRAVYESAPLVFVALLLALALVRALDPQILLRVSSLFDRPPLPPPRFA